MRSSLRGDSELLYPPHDMLARSLEHAALTPQPASAAAGATAPLAGDALRGPSTLQPVIEVEEMGASFTRPRSRPSSARLSARVPSPAAGRRPGSSPAQSSPSRGGGANWSGGGGGGEGEGRAQSPRQSTPGLDTLMRKAEERLRELTLGELTRDGTSGAATSAAGTVDMSTLRRSMQAESKLVPITPGGTGAAGSSSLPCAPPLWLQTSEPMPSLPAGYLPGSSPGGVATPGGTGTGTLTGLAARTEQQMRRLTEFEKQLGALDTTRPSSRPGSGSRAGSRAGTLPPREAAGEAAGGAASGGGAAAGDAERRQRIAPPRAPPPPSSPAASDCSLTARAEERLKRLEKYEAHLGGAAPNTGGSPAESEGGTISRAEGRYARLAQLEDQLKLAGGAEEKEQLDELLHEYLQTKPGSF